MSGRAQFVVIVNVLVIVCLVFFFLFCGSLEENLGAEKRPWAGFMRTLRKQQLAQV
jgi:hypothetical protein